jgi:DNA-binding transcriptional ArsR family regulator
MNTTLMRIFPTPSSFNGFCFREEVEIIKMWITVIVMQARRVGLYDFAEVFVRYILVPLFFSYIFSRGSEEVSVKVYINDEEATHVQDSHAEQDPLNAEILELLGSEGMTVKALLRSLRENWPNLTRHSLRARLTILYDEGAVYNFIGHRDSLLWVAN